MDSRYVEVATKVKELLIALDVDMSNENFIETPRRYATFLLHHFPLDAEIERFLNECAKATFPTTYEGMIAYNNGVIYSICPHHLASVRYVLDLAYISKTRAVGASKLHRIAETLARYPILQEELTVHIADAIQNLLAVDSVAVRLAGEHSCMRVRGVKSNGKIHTAVLRGAFLDDAAVKQEFYSIIENK